MDSEQWNTSNVTSIGQNKVMDAITAELRQTMDILCKQCGLTEEHFLNPIVDVVDDPVYNITGIYYTSNIVYSTAEGDLTASTLVTLLQQWLLEAEENEIKVTVGETYLVIYKPCSHINSNPISITLCPTSLSTEPSVVVPTPAPNESPLNSSQTYNYAMITGTLVGGMLAVTLCTVIAALSWSVKIAP